MSPTDEELRAQAARIEADIAALWVKSAPRMLSEAFDPLGVDVGPWSAGSDEIFKLTVRGKGVGTAFLFSPKKIVVVGLRATDRIDLGRWRSKQFPLRSAADFYELFTAWLWGALTKKKVPIRRARHGAKHRDLLCVSPEGGHDVKFAPHSFVSSNQNRETWRCEVCGHDTTIPSFQ